MKNIINKYILLSIVIITGLNINAQNKLGKSDDLGRIVLNTYISDQIENLPPDCGKYFIK